MVGVFEGWREGALAAIEAHDHFGRTALHLAAAHGDPAAVDTLCSFKAQVDGRSTGGRRALTMAVQKADFRSVVRLLQAGAEVTVDDERGPSPNEAAAGIEDPSLRQEILDLLENPPRA